MAIDQSKLIFDSGWEIDKIEAIGGQDVGAGQTHFYNIDAAWPPVFQCMFSPDNVNWYSIGPYDHAGQIYSTLAWVDGTRLMFSSDIPGKLRFYVWSDKLTY